VDALGLVPFEPAPDFGLALNDFLTQPTERTTTRLLSVRPVTFTCDYAL